MFCPQCGSEIVAGARYCKKCGYEAIDVTGMPTGAAMPSLEFMRQSLSLTREPTTQQSQSGTQAQQPTMQPQTGTGRQAQQPTMQPQTGTGRQQTQQPTMQPQTFRQDQATTMQPETLQPQTIPGAQGPSHYPQPPKKRSKAPLFAALGGAAAVLVAVVVAVVILRGRVASEPQVVATEPGEAPSIAVEGHAVTAYERPNLMQGALRVSADQYPAQVAAYTWASDLTDVDNYDDFQWMIQNNPAIRESLARNGFAVSLNTGSAKYNGEFHTCYEDNRYAYIPSFITTDSMMHTYHLYFAHLLKTSERTYLADAMREVGQGMLTVSQLQLEGLRGTEWEGAARRNVAFFAVGTSLIDPSTAVPADVSSEVQAELALIYAGQGVDISPLFGGYEDYSQYKPRGYYAGDEALERYFRMMMWYGRMSFLQKEEDLDRSAALIALGMEGTTLERWEACYAVTSFFAGASDDCGWYEYRPVIDEVYGEEATLQSLIDGGTEAWERYHELTAAMPAPLINSIPVDDDGEDHLEGGKSFRFMGQRFSFDATIFQNLMYNILPEGAGGAQRLLPDALDVPAAMGSDVALSVLVNQGVTSTYSEYEPHVQTLREAISALPEETWRSNLYNQWLHTLQPLLEEKGEGYPAFMQSEAWSRKDLVTYLGSYTELKHDTVLYTKQAMAEMGGMGPEEKDDRGYVEPEPVLYGRLAELCRATREGLARYNMVGSEDASNLQLLEELASRLTTIAGKELSGASLSADEYDLIRTYGGQLEHFWYEVYKYETDKSYFETEDFPAAIVADVATDPNGRVLELGTGNPSTIYVVVNVEGSTRIARGMCYSFYQFEWPLSDRLTDTTWRQMMGIELNDYGNYNDPQQTLVEWAQDFSYDPRGSF